MDPSKIVEYLLVILGSAGFGAFVPAVFGRKKMKVDAVSVLSSTSIALVAPLEKQIERLSKSLELSETRANTLDSKLRDVRNDLAYAKNEMLTMTVRVKNMKRELDRYHELYGGLPVNE